MFIFPSNGAPIGVIRESDTEVCLARISDNRYCLFIGDKAFIIESFGDTDSGESWIRVNDVETLNRLEEYRKAEQEKRNVSSL